MKTKLIEESDTMTYRLKEAIAERQRKIAALERYITENRESTPGENCHDQIIEYVVLGAATLHPSHVSMVSGDVPTMLAASASFVPKGFARLVTHYSGVARHHDPVRL